jgi:hypothetical protein
MKVNVPGRAGPKLAMAEPATGDPDSYAVRPGSHGILLRLSVTDLTDGLVVNPYGVGEGEVTHRLLSNDVDFGSRIGIRHASHATSERPGSGLSRVTGTEGASGWFDVQPYGPRRFGIDLGGR